MLPNSLPAFSVGPFFALAANAILVIMCVVILAVYPAYRPLRMLTIFNVFITTAFLGWVIYGIQESPESILLGNRILYASLALLPAVWFHLQLSFFGERPSPIAWSVAGLSILLCMLSLFGTTSLLFDLPLEADPFDEGIMRPQSKLLKPVITAFCLLMCLYFLVSILRKILNSWRDRPVHLVLMAAGLFIWMLGGLHDGLRVAGIAVITEEFILWFCSFWLSVFLAMAVTLHTRALLTSIQKARERVINHLSHELSTPLSIIKAVFVRLSTNLPKESMEVFEKTIERGERNVLKLMDLQYRIQDIIAKREFENNKMVVSKTIEGALHAVTEVLQGGGDGQTKAVLQAVSEHLDAILERKKPRLEKIVLDEFLHTIRCEACTMMPQRQLEIKTDFKEGLTIKMDRDALYKVCSGLLRNAIENTPDEGRIMIRLKTLGRKIIIEFQDYGIGIVVENTPMLFNGFFHTQETEDYSTKKPYLFDAGGSGSDLLRAKVLSERHGFQVGLKSKRCSHLPTDADRCPGRISKCGFVSERSACLSSGGSTFFVEFSLRQFEAHYEHARAHEKRFTALSWKAISSPKAEGHHPCCGEHCINGKVGKREICEGVKEITETVNLS